MRFRIPPFLPPYAVLLMVVAYALGSLWLGLARFDAITRLTESAAQRAATLYDLQELLHAVNEIEAAGRGFALTADDSYVEPFERERRRVPLLLSALRDKVRQDASELALIEELVPLIGERTMITALSIEKKRSAPEQPFEMAFGRRDKDTSEAIRAIVASLAARGQKQLDQAKETLAQIIGEAQRDLYFIAGLTLLLVIMLFLAVRRLRSFISVVPSDDAGKLVAVATDRAAESDGAGVGNLLHDAMLRARVAADAAPSDSAEREHILAMIEAIEHAMGAHAAAFGRDPSQPEAKELAGTIVLLGHAYSRPDGLTIKSTIDQAAKVEDARNAFLILRTAEWALEAITHRKRNGNAGMELTADNNRIFLHIHALIDNPKLSVRLTPKEAEDADALRQGVGARAGTFVVGEGPTGFSVTLSLPAKD